MSDAPPPTADASAEREKQLADDVQKAKDAGWMNRIPFNYETVVGGEAPPDETYASAPWLSDAAVYEWNDEYGEVGPENPQLEKMLYEDPNMMRVGGAIKALSFDVDVQGGGEKIAPIRSVSLLNQTKFHVLITRSLRMPVSIQSWPRMSSCASTTTRHRSSLTVSLRCLRATTL